MKEKIFIGSVLILAGVLFLLSNLEILSLEKFWPIFVLAPGILFIFMFYKEGKNIGYLMPATICTIYGLLFFYCEFSDWDSLSYLWPIFIMAPGIGFLLMYFFGGYQKGFLIAGSIISFISLVFLGLMDTSTFFWPIFLIGLGIYFLLLKK